MKQYPLVFEVSAESNSGIQSLWESTAPGNKSITMSIPPEFDGPGGGFSPEDLYAMALQNCFLATFKVIAEKSNLLFQRIQIQTSLSVDRNENGKPWM